MEGIKRSCIDRALDRWRLSDNKQMSFIEVMNIALEEYARLMIDKDRERVKEKIREDDGAFTIESAFERTPITLD